ncbi:MAG: isoprenyl transferase [Anaerolineae bacterium]|nr:isoprenyl transferase [Thermoflexus sp.]MDW8064234.1 isoprenyl transferase [Anaerolineae bacterium]
MSQQNGRQVGTILKIPTHIAIIMDGNGRWAKARGLPRLAGHRAGTENLRQVIEACADLGVRILTIYAFSTENWRRPPDEVYGLFDILEEMIDRELDSLDRNGVQIRHLGTMEGVPERLQQKIRTAIERTRGNSQLILCVAFNYGGRQEIVEAVRRMIADGLPPEAVDESIISRYLYTAGLPDPDLIIRTSGEMRLSNFLLWQAAYSEFYVTPVYWPDFDREELLKAIEAYSRRERRFGQISEQLAAQSSLR